MSASFIYNSFRCIASARHRETYTQIIATITISIEAEQTVLLKPTYDWLLGSPSMLWDILTPYHGTNATKA